MYENIKNRDEVVNFRLEYRKKFLFVTQKWCENTRRKLKCVKKEKKRVGGKVGKKVGKTVRETVGGRWRISGRDGGGAGGAKVVIKI